MTNLPKDVLPSARVIDIDGATFLWGTECHVNRLSDWLKRRLASRFQPLIDTDSVANRALMKTYYHFRNGDGSFSNIDEMKWLALSHQIAICQLLNEIVRFSREAEARFIIGSDVGDALNEKAVDKRQDNQATVDARELLRYVICKLNERESFVLEHRLLGETDREIASALGVCAHTVRRVRRRIAKVAQRVMDQSCTRDKGQGTRDKGQGRLTSIDIEGIRSSPKFFGEFLYTPVAFY